MENTPERRQLFWKQSKYLCIPFLHFSFTAILGWMDENAWAAFFFPFFHSTSNLLLSDEGTKARPFGHAQVLGIERAPLKVTKAMSEKKIAKRSCIKPFLKVINFNHFMVTRYAVDNLELKSVLTEEAVKDPSKRKGTRKALKKLLQERYLQGSNRWFFQKLRF